MESNKPALKLLLIFLITVVFVFFTEKKFLVNEMRGETLGNYEKLKWIDRIVLLIDDFEGLKSDSITIQKAGFFGYGNSKITLDSLKVDNKLIAAKNCLKVEWAGEYEYGGWGKGVGRNFDLNTLTDYLSFRIYVPKNNGNTDSLKIMLEEDDNHNGTLETDKDDSWFYKINVKSNDTWQFISIPLKVFKDANNGGDGTLNITRKGGLHTIIFSFEQVKKNVKRKWYFDFICFTTGKILI